MSLNVEEYHTLGRQTLASIWYRRIEMEYLGWKTSKVTAQVCSQNTVSFFFCELCFRFYRKRKMECRRSSSPASDNPNKSWHLEKSCAQCFEINYEFYRFIFLPQRETINSNVYCYTLQKLWQAIQYAFKRYCFITQQRLTTHCTWDKKISEETLDGVCLATLLIAQTLLPVISTTSWRWNPFFVINASTAMMS